MHDLARTGITRALLDGLAATVERDPAGHSKVETTMRYDKGVKAPDLREALQERQAGSVECQQNMRCHFPQSSHRTNPNKSQPNLAVTRATPAPTEKTSDTPKKARSAVTRMATSNSSHDTR